MHGCERSVSVSVHEIDILGVCLRNLSGVGWEGGVAACMVAGINYGEPHCYPACTCAAGVK